MFQTTNGQKLKDVSDQEVLISNHDVENISDKGKTVVKEVKEGVGLSRIEKKR